MQPATTSADTSRLPSQRPTRVRHVVLGLTVAAYMITYMDRQILAVARPVIRDELGHLARHDGLDHLRFPHGLRVVPNPRRLARRPLRRAPRSDRDRHLVEHLHRASRPWPGTPPRCSSFRSSSAWAKPARSPSPRARSRAGCGPPSGASRKASRTPARAWARRSRRPSSCAIIAAFGWRAAFLVFGVLGVMWAVSLVFLLSRHARRT